MAQNAHNAGKAAASLRNQATALEMRMAGYSYARIGREIGKSQTQAFRLVQKGLAIETKVVSDIALELRQVQMAQLNAMLAGLWQEARTGGTLQVDRVLKIMERQAALVGADAPQKIAAVNPDGSAAPETRYIVPVPANVDLGTWLQQYAPTPP
jgi:hypothetical protein